MARTTFNSNLALQISKNCNQHGVVTEEIDGLIKVHQDGFVERPEIVPCVTASLAPELGVISRDIVIDKFTNFWARFYVPKHVTNKKLPLLVYFHGGGFCVGSASWICYHEFLAKLASFAGCVIVSVEYRLAPENRLPAAYEDGVKALMWIKEQGLTIDNQWWSMQCDFDEMFLAGDSAGANIAYNVATRIASFKPFCFSGLILIQPFFGGESRTNSEKHQVQLAESAVDLAASDTFWRLALPCGANRDHPWCNPMVRMSLKTEEIMRQLPKTMVCVSEMDIMKDRNLEFVRALNKAGNKRVQALVHKGVGHAFQVLGKSQVSQTRTLEMMSQIKTFISS